MLLSLSALTQGLSIITISGMSKWTHSQCIAIAMILCLTIEGFALKIGVAFKIVCPLFIFRGNSNVSGENQEIPNRLIAADVIVAKGD